MSEGKFTCEIPENGCRKCRQPSVRKCEECGEVYCFCSESQDHWDKCKAVEIDQAEGGFFVKAARDLVSGEVILREAPLVFGPKSGIGLEGQLICVGCCRLIASVDNSIQCPECSWPVCSLQCDGLKNTLSHGLECGVLKLRKNIQESPLTNFRFDILLPLRVLFLQKTDPIAWEKLLNRLEKDKLNIETTETVTSKLISEKVDFLEEKFLGPLQKIEEETNTVILEQKSKSLLYNIIKMLITNSQNVTEDIAAQIHYPTVSLITHSCTPNSLSTINPASGFKITVRATSAISKNVPITANHTNLLQGTYTRLEYLKSTERNCSCGRCSDPTELGTFFSALKCMGTKAERCGGAQLPIDPTSDNTKWICDKCKIELPQDQIVKFVKHLGGEVSKVLARESSVEEMEKFLEKLLMFLHPNHFHVYSVKCALVRLYGTEADSLSKKIKLCEDLVVVARKLFPSGSLHLGELLHQLFEAKFLVLSGRNEEESSSDYTEVIRELTELLEENKKIRLFEFEEKFRQNVAEDEAKLDAWLKNKSIT